MLKYIQTKFEDVSAWISQHLGDPLAFMIAVLIVFVWFLSGPIFNYSDTWQLVINTSTTIVTFLMVFLLQNTGNRTIEEMHERLRIIERQNRELLEKVEKKKSRKK